MKNKIKNIIVALVAFISLQQTSAMDFGLSGIGGFDIDGEERGEQQKIQNNNNNILEQNVNDEKELVIKNSGKQQENNYQQNNVEEHKENNNDGSVNKQEESVQGIKKETEVIPWRPSSFAMPQLDVISDIKSEIMLRNMKEDRKFIFKMEALDPFYGFVCTLDLKNLLILFSYKRDKDTFYAIKTYNPQDSATFKRSDNDYYGYVAIDKNKYNEMQFQLNDRSKKEKRDWKTKNQIAFFELDKGETAYLRTELPCAIALYVYDDEKMRVNKSIGNNEDTLAMSNKLSEQELKDAISVINEKYEIQRLLLMKLFYNREKDLKNFLNSGNGKAGYGYDLKFIYYN